MVIELRGVEFINKGAELMLHAIVDRLKRDIPDAIFVMEDTVAAPRKKHLEHGIYTKTNFKKFKLNFKYVFQLIPLYLRRKNSYINESEVDVVLDGSGFAFGDQWGARKAGARLADHIIKWKKSGVKVVLLPQAFGPFTDSELIGKMKMIIQNADLICARDRISYDYLKALDSSTSNIILQPDFTNLIKGTVPDSFRKMQGKIAIIPNNKMIETANPENGAKYLDLLRRMIAIIKKSGNDAFFLIHEGRSDIKIANEINKDSELAIPVLQEDSSLYVKGMIGASKAVITSRFHGLVSCLSQSVPCLATGWSHKYEMLLEDYGYSEGLIDISCGDQELDAKINSLINEPQRKVIIENLHVKGLRQKELTDEMWKKVTSVIKEN